MAQGGTAAGSSASDGQAEAPLRVVLADDDVLLRSGLASLLDRPGFSVVGQAGDAETLLPLVRELVPDLVVVDIRMPPTQPTSRSSTR
jgi:DNA-binding NarL/FixJ family response regulator